MYMRACIHACIMCAHHMCVHVHMCIIHARAYMYIYIPFPRPLSFSLSPSLSRPVILLFFLDQPDCGVGLNDIKAVQLIIVDVNSGAQKIIEKVQQLFRDSYEKVPLSRQPPFVFYLWSFGSFLPMDGFLTHTLLLL